MTDSTRRSASYSRVSTSEQSTIQQLERLRNAAPGAAEYVDDAVSGRLDHRPEFDRLRTAIERREVGEVYVCKIDRLGRSAKAVLEFFELAERHGCRVVVTDQGVDTSTPVGRVVRTILAALAELEADLIRERTQAAMDSFKDGSRTPKGRVGRKPVVTPELVAQIRTLREGRGLQWSAIARTVHHPASSCRKWYSASRAGKLRVINGPGEFPPTSGKQGDLSAVPKGTVSDSTRAHQESP